MPCCWNVLDKPDWSIEFTCFFQSSTIIVNWIQKYRTLQFSTIQSDWMASTCERVNGNFQVWINNWISPLNCESLQLLQRNYTFLAQPVGLNLLVGFQLCHALILLIVIKLVSASQLFLMEMFLFVLIEPHVLCSVLWNAQWGVLFFAGLAFVLTPLHLHSH